MPLRLRTVQPTAVLRRLRRGQTHRPVWERCVADGWLGEGGAPGVAAYRWMAQQLARRDPAPSPDALPVWAWHGHEPPSRFRRARPHQELALLELEIAPERALLSDWGLWHWALRGWYLGSVSEMADPPGPVEDSWERILDPAWRAPDWFALPPGHGRVQAVLWEVRPEDVVGARTFAGWPQPALPSPSIRSK